MDIDGDQILTWIWEIIEESARISLVEIEEMKREIVRLLIELGIPRDAAEETVKRYFAVDAYPTFEDGGSAADGLYTTTE